MRVDGVGAPTVGNDIGGSKSVSEPELTISAVPNTLSIQNGIATMSISFTTSTIPIWGDIAGSINGPQITGNFETRGVGGTSPYSANSALYIPVPSNFRSVAAPEPGTLALMASMGLISLMAKRKKASSALTEH